jgi:hypothetical protein
MGWGCGLNAVYILLIVRCISEGGKLACFDNFLLPPK